MQTHTKQSYHPYILVAFYLQILPETILLSIPRSTRYEWGHKNVTELFGYDWYLQNQYLFHTLQQVAASNKLLRVNKALLRIIALQRFLQQNHIHIRHKLFNAASVAVKNIQKVKDVFGIRITLKYLNLSQQQYWQLKQKTRCTQSFFNLCILKHPSQLLRSEVNMIKQYCNDHRFFNWPLASVYHQMIRDKAASLHISTFYKYVGLLQLKRIKANHRHKNHQPGIRAAASFQLLHADVTVFKTADHTKAYIYLAQDNFSRAILHYAVSTECKATVMLLLLRNVYVQHLQGTQTESCMLMTDDGHENYGPVQQFLSSTESPALKHIVAQRDVEFSNSMIEAAHKNLKYHFLYHKIIPNLESLCKFVPEAIDDFNNRPNAVLNGLTPLEMLNGIVFDKNYHLQQMQRAKAVRISRNKEQKCCEFSF